MVSRMKIEREVRSRFQRVCHNSFPLCSIWAMTNISYNIMCLGELWCISNEYIFHSSYPPVAWHPSNVQNGILKSKVITEMYDLGPIIRVDRR